MGSGISGAMNSALGGINAYSGQVNNISENLANANTVAYKRVDSSFQSYVTQTSQTSNSPGGVTIKPSYRNSIAGQVTASDNSTSFAISGGSGFVQVLSQPAQPARKGVDPELCYTRACDFAPNKDGYLVNSAGQFLQAIQTLTFPTNKEPNFEPITIKNDQKLVPIADTPIATTDNVLPNDYKLVSVKAVDHTPPVASSIINANANFPAGVAAVPFVDGTTQKELAAQVTMQVPIYDSTGVAYNLQAVFQRVPVSGTAPQTPSNQIPGIALFDTASEWQLVSTSIPVNPPATGAPFTVPTPPVSLYFTSKGALNGDTTTCPEGPKDPAGNPIYPAGTVNIPIPIDWTTAPPGFSTSTSPDTQHVYLGFGTIATTVTAQATGTTQFAGSNVEMRSMFDVSGSPPGDLVGTSINQSGDVVYSYSNGHTLKPYKVPIVTFADPSKLDRITGALFADGSTYYGKKDPENKDYHTLSELGLSGNKTMSWPGSGQGGTIAPNSVETSNVDVSSELTKMILAQRSYSANAKTITTANEIIQEGIALAK